MGHPAAWILAFACGALHEDLDQQIARVTRLIEREPDRAILRFRRGELHRLHEDWAAARADFERARVLDPALAVVDLALGRVCNRSGDARGALAALGRFLANQPDHAEGLLERARARAAVGERAAAAKDFGDALSRMEEPWAENYLERSEVLRADGRLDEAIRGLEEGLAKIGPALPLRLALADLEVEAGRIDAALAHVDAIAAGADRKDLWLLRRGEILRKAGRPEEAGRAFRAALASIDALPAARRRTKFTQELEARARAALEAMHENR
jgi:predicted Zn-dependent protease